VAIVAGGIILIVLVAVRDNATTPGMPTDGGPTADPTWVDSPPPRESACGEVCSFKPGVGQHRVSLRGEKVSLVNKNMNCPVLWAKLLVAFHTGFEVQWPPPRWAELPKWRRDAYTMNGQIEIPGEYYIKPARYAGGSMVNPVWDKAALERAISSPSTADFPKSMFSYDHATLKELATFVSKHSDKTSGKIGLVVGSERPWVEIIANSRTYGKAKGTWTLEYGKLESAHPSFTTRQPDGFAIEMLARNSEPLFDFAITFSSLEHSGLGRYGDPLDPYGDLEAAAQVWCSLKPGGYFFFGVPTSVGATYKDYLFYNAHRVYGVNRLAQVFANFEIVEDFAVGPHHPAGAADLKYVHTVFLLRKVPQPAE